MRNSSNVPDMVPILSRGRHRQMRKGACFMELASYLAGEKWSDHPKCTHPLLGALARMVNDHIGDDVRQELIPVVPSVIGLQGRKPWTDARIARECALTALPIVSASGQSVAAVGVLRSERVLNSLAGRPHDPLTGRAVEVLGRAPRAHDWARTFSGVRWGDSKSFVRRSAPAIVTASVSHIAVATVPDPEHVLVDLLRRCIDLTREDTTLAAVEADCRSMPATGSLTRH
ncbi:MAG TPA: hypothetical protein VFM09_14795 [Marmoricola sp.]|nr:hypothetical protein [Marmoricola sp.]